MKRVLFTLVAAVAWTVEAEGLGDGFQVGCNYWASHAGTEMWRRWDADVVERDFAKMAAHGMTLVRVFPIWRDFQPIAQLRPGNQSPREIAWKDDGPLPNPEGVDDEMVARFRTLCDSAAKNRIRLVVGLVTGFMSSRGYVPPALEGRSPINDPECVKWEVRFIRRFIRALKDHPAVAAWDLGNECNCMGADSAASAWRWLDEIGAAIRLADPTRPVVSGMHGCSANRDAAWNLYDQGELMDFTTTHPYPLWTPDCNRERFDSLRDEAHAAAESLLYEGLSGKPCLVEEAGSMGPTVVSEARAAAAMRVALFNCWAEGLPGYLWWCAFDQDKLDFAPYDWTFIERELGLFKADGTPKPTVLAMRDFAAFLKTLPFDRLPAAKRAAVCLLSNRADVWRPAFGAYLLSRQAGFGLSYASAEKPLPEAKLYILPAMPGYAAYSGRAWNRLLEKVRAGATAFVSLGGDAGHSGFLEATGLETLDHHVGGVSYDFAFADAPDRTIKASDSYVRENAVRTARILAADSKGRPVVSVNRLGKGKVVYCNFPIETMGIVSGGCWTGADLNPLYLVYAAAAREAGVAGLVEKGLPGVGVSEHPLPDGRTVVVAINYEPEAVSCPLKTGRPVEKCLRGSYEKGVVKIGANDAAILILEDLSGEMELSDWEFSRDGTTWKPVMVPHDWAIEGPFDLAHDRQTVRIVENGEAKATDKVGRTGSLPWIGTGEYRRTVAVPADAEWASLVFDGAMSEPEVFLNGTRIGGWKNGYTPFEVELPSTGGVVVVKLENPPLSSRWYPGAGLYRPVTLRWGKRVGVKTWGVDILTPDLETVVATAELRNPDNAQATVEFAVLDGNGTCVAKGASPLKVKNAHAWSPEDPYLYTLVTTVRVGGKVVDENVRKFGIRTLEYGPGFFKLNGQARKFQGVCLHHDLGPLGAAFSKDAFRRQVRLLKEMGCDSIRTSHNHPAPGQLDVCDEEGLMVVAESFDAWAEVKVKNGYNRFFKDWWKKDLARLVEYGRGHPSVVMWSIGNEISEQRHEKGAALYAEMQAYVHSCDRDKTRPVSAGASWMPNAIESGFIAAMDIPAVTYRLPFYEAMHAAAPRQGSVLGIETASTVSSRGEYYYPVAVTNYPHHANGQCSGYDTEYCCWSNLPDDDWAMQEDHPWTIGEFVWTGFDYLGEPTPYDDPGPSHSSYFGILDLAGLPKDRYHLYRSHWRKDAHTLHLVPHWTFPGREGQVTPVYCYTDFDEAELFVNGQSQGRRKKDKASRLDRFRLRWNDVVYAPGELKVVAYGRDGKPAKTETVRTAGPVASLKLEKRRFGNLLFVTVSAVDAKGTLVPDASDTVRVTAGEGLTFKAIANGDATSLEPFVKPEMKLFHGQLVAVFEGSGENVFVLK